MTSETTRKIEFFFDPICPWAWITSRWISEVGMSLDLDISWKFISLMMVNEEKYSTGEIDEHYQAIHTRGHKLLRLAARMDRFYGNQVVGMLYTKLGIALHHQKMEDEILEPETLAKFLNSLQLELLNESKLDLEALIESIEDPSWDDVISEDTKLALSRTGDNVGTPIITFGESNNSTFFGPVLSSIPTGDKAVELFNHIYYLATFDGFAELKRSLREPRQLPNLG